MKTKRNQILFVLITALLNHAAAKQKERPWLAAPLVVANPSFGNGLGGVGMYFFKTDPTSAKNPASAITMAGSYSDTDSYFLGVFARTHWNDDTWRINGGVAHPRINNEFTITGISDEVVFTAKTVALFARWDRRIGDGNVFLGVRGKILDNQYTDANAAAEQYFLLADVQDTTSAQLSLLASHDTRDHLRYPTRGHQTELGWTTAPEAWGASESFHITEGFSNHFLSLAEQQVLALRAYGRFTPSGTPYSGQSTLGRRADLRGYTTGEKVAENLITLQSEYRTMFNKKLGAVAFFGISQLYDGALKDSSSDDFYPSGGLGFRYRLNEENKMNFRFDYAWGSSDERGFYVSVGESF